MGRGGGGEEEEEKKWRSEQVRIKPWYSRYGQRQTRRGAEK